MWCPALELAGHWVVLGLSLEMEISGRALIERYYMGPGGLWWSSVLNSVLPPQRLRPDTRLGQHGSEEKGEKKKDKIIIINFKIKKKKRREQPNKQIH